MITEHGLKNQYIFVKIKMKICSIFSRQKNASAESVLREWYAIFCLFLFPGEYVRMKPENPQGQEENDGPLGSL